MKKYSFNENGMMKYDGAMDFEGEVDKSVQVLSGDGEWRYLYGCKVFVAQDGLVIRGYDPLIGRMYSDLEKLNFSDIFNIQRSVQRAVGATNKSFETQEEIDQRKDILKAVQNYIDKRIKEAKQYESNINFERNSI